MLAESNTATTCVVMETPTPRRGTTCLSSHMAMMRRSVRHLLPLTTAASAGKEHDDAYEEVIAISLSPTELYIFCSCIYLFIYFIYYFYCKKTGPLASVSQSCQYFTR